MSSLQGAVNVMSQLNSEITGAENDVTNEELFQLKLIERYMGKPLTDEQRAFASNFNRDIISFSDPGTGKTHTLIAGIVMAQKHHEIPGSRILCMSYTRAATLEIEGRYKELCHKMRTPNTVPFKTFHSFTNGMLRDVFTSMTVLDKGENRQAIEDMQGYFKDLQLDIPCNDRYALNIIRVINELNSAFVFDERNIEKRYSFKQLDMPIEYFNKLRRAWFFRGVMLDQITQGEIPLYCLYALMNNPEVANKWRGKYDIVIIDEFQDMSPVNLQILSRVAKSLIVVGDMKQQIYTYNGACPEIVDMYYRIKPDAIQRNLTKSFRCSKVIADFATKIIKPNYGEIEAFEGFPNGPNVQFVDRRNLDWTSIVDRVDMNNLQDFLILYRNNASTVPLVDVLYTKGIPFRCSKFKKVMDIPVLESMCKLVNAAWNPKNENVVREALALFPEFRRDQYNIPVLSAMRSSGKSLFDVNYRYVEDSSYNILSAMRAAQKSILTNDTAGKTIMQVKDVYEKYILPAEFWKLGTNTELYYLNMAAPIANMMTYPKMSLREQNKADKEMECSSSNIGLRCYTMHASKGLEAETVYILDCNEGLLPNSGQLERKIKAGCLYDAAVNVRTERNVLYVAATRAKKNLIVSYSDASLTRLITDPDAMDYHQLDKVYEDVHSLYEDEAEFFKLFRE
ncbi:MAG: ATP-dependent helicase [Roseburia sp.]|nr:ATP-dependent helicase [Roseburia sp.]